MIRLATQEDHAACVAMAKEFWEHTHYSDEFDSEHVTNMVALSQSHELLLVLIIDGTVSGFVSGIAIPLLANKAVTQVTELAYWINPEHRGKYGIQLMHALELAAKRIGAKYLNMIAMESSNPEVAERIYINQDFVKIETTYCKELVD